jgi:hypothetical protein
MIDVRQMLEQKTSWTQAEKNKTMRSFQTAEQKKTSFVQFLDIAVFWVALFVAILGNFILSIVLVPFLLIMSGWMLYASLFFVGLSFGLLFAVIISYIEKIETKHHIIAGVFIPALALINVYIITYFANELIVLLKLTTTAHNPGLVSITYVVAFTLPYLIGRSRKAFRK